MYGVYCNKNQQNLHVQVFIAINTNRTYMYSFYCNTNQQNLHVQLRNSHAPNILNSLLFSGFGNFSADLRKAPQTYG